MGSDKAQLEVGGTPLGARIADQVGALGIPVTVLGNQPLDGHEFLADAEQYGGPLVALSRFTPGRDLVFVASCDLVQFDARLIELLSGGLGQNEAAIPVSEGRLQPLCALYRRDAWAKLAGVVSSGRRSMMAWIDDLRISHVSEEDLVRVGLDPRCVLGANTPGEFARALNENGVSGSNSRH